jgi:hypothetical protein
MNIQMNELHGINIRDKEKHLKKRLDQKNLHLQ